MDELIKIEQQIQFTPATISYNKQKLLDYVTPITNKYKNIVVTNDNLDSAKEIKAELNKMYKEIEDERKSIKKIYNEPLYIFEAEVKECTDLIISCVDNINTQLQVYENERIEAKSVECYSIIETLSNDYALDIKYKKMIIFNGKWLNKTAKIKDITAEIETQVHQLSKQQDNEKELAELKAKQLEQERIAKEQEIVKRTELINKLNSQYEINFTYNQVANLSDIDLLDKAEKLYNDKQKRKNLDVEALKVATHTLGDSIYKDTTMQDIETIFDVARDVEPRRLVYEFDNTTEKELNNIFKLIQAKFTHITIRKF